jgi:3-mercaptopyruvate sulfurtransferase SseA
MMPSPDFFAADKTFKPRAELKRMASYLGIRPEQQVTTYCGGGIAAATPFFALRFLLDHPKVKLYAGSQFEWLQDDRGLPMWTYSAPNLMRETPWVKAWTSKMMHAVGAVRVSLVDVRPAAAYQVAHLPFSLNVPAEVFRAHVNEPDKLAQLLGQAGVNPAFEAVVVSEAGLDADAALAYLALERLGQRRVSVFMDTLERWAELGQEVAREPTVVGEAKKPGDVPVPRSAYAPSPRSGFVLGEAAGGASSLYPKVFVAMGAKAPANTAERTWVHLPAKSLLQADGRPLAAKDLWAAISKAGVPRYAEIVLAGDAPGEAAMGHFLFRLLGFPDVKVVAP